MWRGVLAALMRFDRGCCLAAIALGRSFIVRSPLRGTYLDG